MSDIYRQYPDSDEVVYSYEYGLHINRMTREDLRSKSDIALELAWRDIQLAKAEAACDALREVLIQILEAMPGTDDAAHRAR